MVSVGWMQDQAGFISARVFPTVSVAKQSDLYFEFSRADWLRALAEKRAPSTESAGGGFNVTTSSYFADVWAFHKDVSDQTRANADNPLAPDRNAAEFTTGACMRRQEFEWAASYFTTSVWDLDQTGVTGTSPGANEFQFWNETEATPIVDLRNQIVAVEGSTGFRPNKLVLGAETWNFLQDHADFLARINAGQTPGGPAIANLAQLAAILEIDEVLVARAVRNTAVEGATEATSFIMTSKSALLLYAAPSPAIETPSAGYTFAWSGFTGAVAGMRQKRFRMEAIESDRVECEMAWDQKVVATELGRFFDVTFE